MVERYVKARGWMVVARYLEQGVGGAARYRQVVDQILDGARHGRFEAVVIFRGDRSFRSAGKGCLVIDELIATGCAFVRVEDGIDTHDPGLERTPHRRGRPVVRYVFGAGATWVLAAWPRQ